VIDPVDEKPQGYPEAKFLLPSRYTWDEDFFEAEEAVKAYLRDVSADQKEPDS
jgi:hypothetical protein